MNKVKTLAVRCPSCQTEVLMTAEYPDRPFCSKRCRMIDLGEWASEGYRIPEQTPEDFRGEREE